MLQCTQVGAADFDPAVYSASIVNNMANGVASRAKARGQGNLLSQQREAPPPQQQQQGGGEQQGEWH